MDTLIMQKKLEDLVQHLETTIIEEVFIPESYYGSLTQSTKDQEDSQLINSLKDLYNYDGAALLHENEVITALDNHLIREKVRALLSKGSEDFTDSDKVKEATDALLALGYSSTEVKKVIRELKIRAHMTSEDILTLAFEKLSSF